MLLLAIAWQRIICRCINQRLIMQFDGVGYILVVTVAHFDCVVIKYFVIKYFVINSWRNLFPTFMEITVLKARLNQMMLHCRFLFVWMLLLVLKFNSKLVCQLSLRAFSYWYLDELMTSSLKKFLDKCSLVIFGNWLIIFEGWFENLLMNNNKSYGFLYSVYVLLFKFNVMCKKSSILRLGYTSVAKPMSLNILIILLHIRFICWPFTFLNMKSSLSL